MKKTKLLRSYEMQGYVDTFILQKQLDIEEYKYFTQRKKETEKKGQVTILKEIKGKNNRNFKLKNKNMNIWIYKNKGYNSFINIEIKSIPLLLDGKPGIKLYGDLDKPKIKEELNAILEANPYMGSVDEYTVKRIDYAFQIKYKSQNQVDCLLNILHKTNKVRAKNTRGDYVESLYEYNNSSTYNYYDKHAELTNKRQEKIDLYGSSDITDALIKESDKLFRFEIQIKNVSYVVKSLQKKGFIVNNSFDGLFRDRIAREVLTTRLRTLLRSEDDFYDKSTAIAKYKNYKAKIDRKPNPDIIQFISTNAFSGNDKFVNTRQYKTNMKNIKINPIIIENQYRIATITNPLGYLIRAEEDYQKAKKGIKSAI